MLRFLLLSSLCLLSTAVFSQLTQQLYQDYERYREPSILDRFSTLSDIEPLIQQLPADFRQTQLGESVEGRAIYQICIGSGSETVLLWSQMHGDEPTATMAIMDLFRFFRASDGYDGLRDQLLEELTICFIPMLNPDGAERYQRRSALGIDLNRDALRLQAPESKILKNARDRLDADWGFNLHDQSRYYSAGRNPHTASMSFLAPAYNVGKSVNDTRRKAMQLIAQMNEWLQPYLPQQVARYDDTFEPRAFGDNIQRWGTSTILIEAGGLKNDPEKQELRRLHFVIFLAAFKSIATKGYGRYSESDYKKIPYNSRRFHDLILRGVSLETNGKWYTMDIAYKRNERQLEDGSLTITGASVSELGDLSVYYGYDNWEGRGYRAVPGKVYPRVISPQVLNESFCRQLLRDGFTDVRLNEAPTAALRARNALRLHAERTTLDNTVRIGRTGNVVLYQDGVAKYAVVMGRLVEL